MLWTDTARLVIGSAVLVFAAWTDLKWRRAPDAAWRVAAGAGAVLLVLDVFLDREAVVANLPALAVAGVIMILAAITYWFGLLMGGADSKALVSFAILGPLPLTLDAVTVLPATPFPLVLTMLGNALVAAPLVPVGLLLWNLAHGDARLPLAFVGYRRPVAGLDDAPVWPLEWVDDGTLHSSFRRHGVPEAGSRERDFAAADVQTVWVTPKIPFLVPLAVGFVAAFFLGDFLGALIVAVLG